MNEVAETQTLTVPTLGSGETSISGEVAGPFIIHRPPGLSWFQPKVWHVTHIKSGMRFPWEFEGKKTARRFARLVRKMTDWEQVECRRGDDPTSAKGLWTTDIPTEEQRKNIRALAVSLAEGER
jgi:hypothetical protein